MMLLPQETSCHQITSTAQFRGLSTQHSLSLRSRTQAARHARHYSSRICRCQSLPEGSGRPLANLRAWGAELFNNLRTGWADQPKRAAQQGAPKQPQQQSSSESSRDAEAPSNSVPAAEQQQAPSSNPEESSEWVVSVADSDEEKEEAPPEEGSWEHWEEHFAEMDRLYEAACEVEGAIEECIGAEEFTEAARLRGVHAEIQERDDVYTIHKELERALAREDYGAAAQLRDAGCAGLVGWWHSRAEDDPMGHILRIAPDFGRYTAVKYSAQDLAELKGWSAESNMFAGYGGGYPYAPVGAPVQPSQQQRGTTGDELAADLMRATQAAEQRNVGVAVMEVFVRRDSEGNWQRQACVASPSAETQQLSAQSMPFPGGMPPALDIHVDNGIPGEDVISMRISLGSNGQPTISDSNAASIEDMLKKMLSPDTGGDGVELPEELHQSLGSGQGMLVVQEDSSSLGTAMEMPSDQPYQQSFERSPANLVRMDKDNFVLTVPSSPESVDLEQQEELEKDPHAQHQGQFDELRRALNMTGPTDSGITSLVQSPPVRPPQAGDEQDESSGGAKDESGKVDPWMKAAKEVRRLHKLNNPNSPLPFSRNELAEVIKNAATGALDVLQQSYATPNFCLEGSRVYSRIKQEEMPKTDPFSGLYLGSFGPHGPEILQLKRSVTESGKECVLGVKVTGDPNVPAGNVSFRALIGRKHRTSGWDVMYPPELDVQARYPGEGRVAQQGFKDAWWVEGELLQFGSNPMIQPGAELGFVWCVPNERRYLILLSRIDLDDPRLNS